MNDSNATVKVGKGTSLTTMTSGQRERRHHAGGRREQRHPSISSLPPGWPTVSSPSVTASPLPLHWALTLSPEHTTDSLLWALTPYAGTGQVDEPWTISLEGQRQEDRTATAPVDYSLELRFISVF